MALHFKFGLRASTTGATANASGGTVYVAQAGSPQKQVLQTVTGAAMSNPFSIVNGVVEFWTVESITSVDIYLQTSGGHFEVIKGVTPSGLNEYTVSNDIRNVTAVIPFAIQDTAAATETTTGFSLPTNAIVTPLGGGVEVTTLESGKTIQVGILSSQSGGSASGFYNALSLTLAGQTVPSFSDTTGTLNGNTYGAFLASYVAGAPGTGMSYIKQYICNGTAKTISYTLSSGTAAAQGFITIPYVLPAV